MTQLREDVPSSGMQHTGSEWQKINETEDYVELYNVKTEQIRKVPKEHIQEDKNRRLLME